MIGISKETLALLNEIAKSENFVEFEIKWSNGSEKGDGFLSDILCVDIVGSKQLENGDIINDQLNLVCKVAFPHASQREQFKSDVAFERETTFYREVAPAFLKFQRDRGLTEEQMFSAFPKCYKTIFDEEKKQFVIILDDLRPKGFRMWPKSEPSKIENARAIVRNLAKLHAVSFAMRDQCPEAFAKFETLNDLWPTYFDSGAFYNIYLQNFERVMNMLDDPKHKRIYELILKNIQGYFHSCSDASVPNKFRVVCHGDAWNNNIMLKPNLSNDTVDVSFLDWQLMRYVSPALDLLYHIFTSTDKQLRDAHYDDLLRLYYDQLATNIRKMGSDPNTLYTFDNLLEGFKQCGNFTPLTAPIVLLFSIAKPDELGDIKNFSETTETAAIREFSEASETQFKTRLTDVIVDMERLGYFREISK